MVVIKRVSSGLGIKYSLQIDYVRSVGFDHHIGNGFLRQLRDSMNGSKFSFLHYFCCANIQGTAKNKGNPNTLFTWFG